MPLALKELALRNVNADSSNKAGIKKLLEELKWNEHPTLKNQKELTEEEAHAVKFFKPKFLAALEWDSDCVDNALKEHFRV